MRKSIAFTITCLLLVAMASSAVLAKGISTEITKCITVCLPLNERLISQFTVNSKALEHEIPGLSVKLSELKPANTHLEMEIKAGSFETNSNRVFCTGKVNLLLRDKLHNIDVAGYLHHITVNDCTGLIGGLDGYLYSHTDKNKKQRVVLDVNYSPSSMSSFATLTIGVAGGKHSPIIISFGEQDEVLNSVAKEYLRINENRLNSRDKDLLSTDQATGDPSSIQATGIDTSIYYQCSNSADTSYGSVAYLSKYHQSEMYNGDTIPVYAKMNSYSSNFEDYLKYEHGFNQPGSFLWVYPETVDIELVSGANLLCTGEHSPEESTTTIDIPLQFYDPFTQSLISLGNVSIVTDSISVEMDSTPSAYPYHNIIRWSIYDDTGLANVDASTSQPYDEDTGIRVLGEYRYHGAVYEQTWETLLVSGAIRYEYVFYMADGTTIVRHMWTDTITASNNVTVFP